MASAPDPQTAAASARVRRPARATLAALAALLPATGLVTACAFTPGHPWGDVEVELSAGFAPGAARLDEAGRLKTAKSWGVEIDELTAVVESVAVQQADPAQASVSFDPASPPPGFSLCHGGHCHADDGRLVTFAEVEATLAGADTAEAPGVVFAVDDEVALAATPVALNTPCPGTAAEGACLLERGPIIGVAIEVSAVRVVGTAFDLLETGEPRAPVEGIPFAIVLAPPAPFFGGLDAEAERFAPLHWRVTGHLAVAESLLDDVEFSTDLVDGALAPDVAAEAALTLVEDSAFAPTIGDVPAPGEEP